MDHPSIFFVEKESKRSEAKTQKPRYLWIGQAIGDLLIEPEMFSGNFDGVFK